MRVAITLIFNDIPFVVAMNRKNGQPQSIGLMSGMVIVEHQINYSYDGRMAAYKWNLGDIWIDGPGDGDPIEAMGTLYCWAANSIKLAFGDTLALEMT